MRGYSIAQYYPKCARLWQRSKVSFTDDEEIWYTNSPLGEKTLSKFMSELSSKVGLSMRYTNHSVRATGATILSKGGFNPAQIMSVTGHKSVSSLTVYQRVSDEEGISMGQTINDHIHNNNQQLIPLPVPPANTLPVPSIRTIANEPFDIELEDMSLEDFQNQDGQESHVRLGLPSAMTTHTPIMYSSQPYRPFSRTVELIKSLLSPNKNYKNKIIMCKLEVLILI